MSLRSHFTQEGELEISGGHMMLLHDCVYSCYGLIELVNIKREFKNIISEHNDIYLTIPSSFKQHLAVC